MNEARKKSVDEIAAESHRRQEQAEAARTARKVSCGPALRKRCSDTRSVSVLRERGPCCSSAAAVLRQCCSSAAAVREAVRGAHAAAGRRATRRGERACSASTPCMLLGHSLSKQSSCSDCSASFKWPYNMHPTYGRYIPLQYASHLRPRADRSGALHASEPPRSLALN